MIGTIWQEATQFANPTPLNETKLRLLMGNPQCCMLGVCLSAASRLSLLQMHSLQNLRSRALIEYSCGWNSTRWSAACPAWPQHDVSGRGASKGFSGCHTVPKLCIHRIPPIQTPAKTRRLPYKLPGLTSCTHS